MLGFCLQIFGYFPRVGRLDGKNSSNGSVRSAG